MLTATQKPKTTTLEIRSPTGDGRGQTKGKQHKTESKASPETLPHEAAASGSATAEARGGVSRRPPKRAAGRGSDRAGADHNNHKAGDDNDGDTAAGGVGAAANGEAESNAEGGKKAERKPARSPRLQAPARSTQGGRRKPPRACAGRAGRSPPPKARGRSGASQRTEAEGFYT